MAADVEAIADAYKLEKFAVVGRSGGAPHALACAALLPDRVTRAAALVGLAPRGADGLDWFDGMAASNVLEFTAAAAGSDGTRRVFLQAPVDTSGPIRPACWPACRPSCPTPTGGWSPTAGIRSMLVRNYAEALRTSAYGWIDDALAFSSPVGIRPGRHHRAGPALARRRMTSSPRPATPGGWPSGSRARPWSSRPAAAHFGALDVLPEILRWLAAGPPPRIGAERLVSGWRSRLASGGSRAPGHVGCGSRSRLIRCQFSSSDRVRVAVARAHGRSRPAPRSRAPPPPLPARPRAG